MENKDKILSLQGLRLYAFLGIFCSHIGIREWGPWGVSIFLVLSGFLMTYNYLDRDIPTGMANQLLFAINKVKRLYPLHIIMMIAAIIVQAAKGMIFYSPQRGVIDSGIIGLHVLLAQSWIPRSGVYFSLNGVSWYLGVSLFCYFVFPFICSIIRTYSTRAEAVKWMIVIYIIQIVVAYTSRYIHVPIEVSKDFTKWVTYVFPVFRLGDFFVGCNLGWLFLNQKKNSDNWKFNSFLVGFFESLLLFGSLLIPCQVLLNNEAGKWLATDILYLPFSSLLVWTFALNRGIISRLSSVRFISFFGGWTQYAFLIHFQVVMDWLMFSHIKNRLLSSAICLFITFLLSGLWEHFFLKGFPKKSQLTS